MLLVNGPHSGLEANLLSIEDDAFSCTVEIAQGARKGQRVAGVPYEDLSKLHVE